MASAIDSAVVEVLDQFHELGLELLALHHLQGDVFSCLLPVVLIVQPERLVVLLRANADHCTNIALEGFLSVLISDAAALPLSW